MEEKVLVVREIKGDGTGGTRKMQWVGEKTVGNVTVKRLQVGDFDRQRPDGEEWFVSFEDDRAVFAGGEVYYPSSTLPEGMPNITATVTEPVVVMLDRPVGEVQSVTVKGQVVMGDPAANPLIVDVDETLDVTLVAPNEIVETFMGDLAAADHYHATGSPLDEPATADIWYVEGTGVVRAEYEWQGAPGKGGFAVEEIVSKIAAANGMDNLLADKVIGPNMTQFRLDTYDVNGTLDADKNTHAKMYLELRWADAEQAKGLERPPVVEEFGTAMGYFPEQLAMTATSLMHPEEAGLGYNYWVALVDQAAKNEAINGISYHVAATYNPSAFPGTTGGDVRASGVILYKLYTP